MKKLSVGVIMGGPSSEHEISLLTGRAFLKNLDCKAYRVRAIAISKKNEWSSDGKRVSPERALKGLDVALLALHGEFGEDGRLQALLEHHGLPYTGSGVVASALGMDKLASRSVFRAHGLFVPATAHFIRKEVRGGLGSIRQKIRASCGRHPWIIKPRSRGSSVGVSLVHSPQKLSGAVKAALRFEDNILAEEYLSGVEVTVPILERTPERPEALPLVEIRPRKSAFFDYKEKYSGEKGAEEIVPARIPKRLARRTIEAGLAAYRLLGCKGYARVDVICSRGRPYVLELNTLPGMTPVSLFPKSAQASGIAYSQLLDILIADALRQ